MKTIALLALVALLLAGCSPSAFAVHFQAQTILAGTRTVALVAVTEARGVELDAVEAAQPTRGPERDAALDAVAGRWAPVGAALDGILSALETWAASVALARAAEENEDLLPSLVDVLARIVQLYGDAVGLARTLGVELPSIPPFVSSLLGGT